MSHPNSQKNAQESTYRDYSYRSLANELQHNEFSNDDNLPAYSDGPSVPQEAPNHPSTHGLPNVDLKKYVVPESTISEDHSTTTAHLPLLSCDPRALMAFLRDQSNLPPKPQIRIIGSHTEMAKEVFDFDLRLNMMNQFIGDENKKLNYVKVVADNEKAFRGGHVESTVPVVPAGFPEWVKRFCADPAKLKTFTLRRQIVNWNTEYLEGQIRSVIAASKYRGQVTVSFPVTHPSVIVHSPTKSLRVCGFDVMSLFVETKRYDVVKSVWPYATTIRDAGNETRKWAVQSEEAWWGEWKDAIRHAVLGRRRGWVTVEDQIEVQMEGKQNGEVLKEWGLPTRP